MRYAPIDDMTIVNVDDLLARYRVVAGPRCRTRIVCNLDLHDLCGWRCGTRHLGSGFLPRSECRLSATGDPTATGADNVC
jgi:hypothetical protein